MGNKCQGFNPINFRIWAVTGVAFFVCLFNVCEAMVVTPTLTQTETHASEHETPIGDAIQVNLNCSFEKEGPM